MLLSDGFFPSRILKDKLLVGSSAFSNMISKLIIEKESCMETLMDFQEDHAKIDASDVLVWKKHRKSQIMY